MINVEVDIYINGVKSFLKKNNDASSYFFGENGEEMFYELVTIFAIENYEEKEDPSLTIEQFEEIRQSVISKFGTSSVSDIVHTLPFSLN